MWAPDPNGDVLYLIFLTHSWKIQETQEKNPKNVVDQTSVGSMFTKKVGGEDDVLVL